MMLLFLAFLCLAGAVFLIGEVATLPSRERERSIRRASHSGFVGVASSLDAKKFRQRAVGPMRENPAGLVLKINPRTRLESISRKLLGGSLGRRITPTGFLAAKGVASAFG